MIGSVRCGMAVVAAMAVLLVAPAVTGAATIVLPRPGQVGLGLQGGYGTLLKSGDLGRDFGNGPTIAVRLRYRMRYERALGLTFEKQRYSIRVPERYDSLNPLAFPGRVHANALVSGLEFYQMFGTRSPTVKMLMVGAGIVQVSSWTINDELIPEGDGTFLSVGLGVERFVYRSWALDLSTRYMRLFIPDDRAHDVQASLGVIFYASY